MAVTLRGTAPGGAPAGKAPWAKAMRGPEAPPPRAGSRSPDAGHPPSPGGDPSTADTILPAGQCLSCACPLPNSGRDGAPLLPGRRWAGGPMISSQAAWPASCPAAHVWGPRTTGPEPQCRGHHTACWPAFRDGGEPRRLPSASGRWRLEASCDPLRSCQGRLDPFSYLGRSGQRSGSLTGSSSDLTSALLIKLEQAPTRWRPRSCASSSEEHPWAPVTS